jgi:integration host factor subunit beta
MSLTKRELVNDVATKLGLTQNEVGSVVQELLDAITASLVEGNRLEIRNFGVFEVKERESRIGRNPRTGQDVPIPKKRVTSFRPGKALKEWVEAGPEHKPVHLFKSDDEDETPPAAPSGGASTPSQF